MKTVTNIKKTNLEIITELGFVVSYTIGADPYTHSVIRLERGVNARIAEAKLKSALPKKTIISRTYEIISISNH